MLLVCLTSFLPSLAMMSKYTDVKKELHHFIEHISCDGIKNNNDMFKLQILTDILLLERNNGLKKIYPKDIEFEEGKENIFSLFAKKSCCNKSCQKCLNRFCYINGILQLCEFTKKCIFFKTKKNESFFSRSCCNGAYALIGYVLFAKKFNPSKLTKHEKDCLSSNKRILPNLLYKKLYEMIIAEADFDDSIYPFELGLIKDKMLFEEYGYICYVDLILQFFLDSGISFDIDIGKKMIISFIGLVQKELMYAEKVYKNLHSSNGNFLADDNIAISLKKNLYEELAQICRAALGALKKRRLTYKLSNINKFYDTKVITKK